MLNQRGRNRRQRSLVVCPAGKKPYAKPLLTDYGDVRDITLAPTPGLFTESGYTYTTVYTGP